MKYTCYKYIAKALGRKEQHEFYVHVKHAIKDIILLDLMQKLKEENIWRRKILSKILPIPKNKFAFTMKNTIRTKCIFYLKSRHYNGLVQPSYLGIPKECPPQIDFISSIIHNFEYHMVINIYISSFEFPL